MTAANKMLNGFREVDSEEVTSQPVQEHCGQQTITNTKVLNVLDTITSFVEVMIWRILHID